MSFSWKPNHKIAVRAIAVVGILAIGFVAVFSFRSCRPGAPFSEGRAFAASLAPVAADGLGVAPDSSFTLSLGESVSLAVVRSTLAIYPPVKLAVKETGSGGKLYSVTPEKSLEPDRVYRFTLSLAGPKEPGYSWAFQVKSPLRVVKTLPGDRRSGAPLTTGIEIEFSREGVDDPAGFFSIEPFVPGTWERHRRTLVYVPRVPLQPETIYTCTVKRGLGLEGSSDSLAEDYVFSFETVEAGQDKDSPDFYFWMDGGTISEFAPTEVPFFSVGYGRYGKDNAPAPEVAVQVYRYRDSARFIAGLNERNSVPFWAYLNRQNQKPTTAGLDRILDVQLQPQQVQYQTYLALPEPLPVGYYLVSFRLEPYTIFSWMQVTDLSSYLIESTNDTAVWFNSLQSGKPVSGVTVRSSSGGAPLATSGAEGLTRFPTPPEAVSRAQGDPGSEPLPPFYIIGKAADGSEVVLDLSPMWNPYDSDWYKADAYWRHLSTDRPLYLPADEVCFWGIVEPRGDAPDVARVTVKLRSGYQGWDGPFGRGDVGIGSDASLILSKEVDVRRHTFEGRLRLPNLRPGWYYLEVVADGVVVVTQGLTVATYTKPAYRIDVSADKNAVFAGEKVSFRVGASFFEGTPAAELRLNSTFSDWPNQPKWGTLVTDMRGQASLTDTIPGGTDPMMLERSLYLQVSAQLPESGPIYAAASVRVFEKDVVLGATSERIEGGQVRIGATLNKVTLDALNAPGALPNHRDQESYIGAPVAGREIKGQVEEIRWEARESGQYYDFVEKVVRKTYDYTEVRVPQTTFAMTTDAGGAATWTFNPEAGKSYLVRLTSQDDKSRAITRELRVHGSGFADPNGWAYYHLAVPDRDKPGYKVGETVSVVARKGEADLPARDGGYLFFTARQGLGAVAVQSEPTYTLTFEEDHVPNLNVLGVYFDGRYYNNLGNVIIPFDYDERKLDVRVTTDKESYGPGDKVVIGVEVREPGGRPVGAEVNLSLVDEALFQLSGQRVDTLFALYRPFLDGYILNTRGSHNQRMQSGEGAESGEGGDIRSDFRDNALFESVTTGSDGKSTVEVTLPDNLTSWRLTYQAFASGVRAGSGTKAVPVRLPFFVELATNQTYLSGDEPVIQARAYGATLPSGAAVSFTATLGKLKADGTSDTRDLAPATGKAFVPANLALGVLQRGSYELTVTGRATLPDGTKAEDTLVRTFEVTDTYLRLNRVDYYEVTGSLRVAAEPGEMVTLTFCDAGRGDYLGMLWRLSGGGRRADAKAAAIVAHRLLIDDFGYKAEALGAPPTESELLACQGRGGVSLLPYADPDLELTAKAAALGGAGFDQDGLLSYLGEVFDAADTSRERFAVALYGLAALDQPVLLDLERLAAEPDLSVKEKLYACLGLIELGAEEKARKLLQDVLAASGDRIGPLLRLDVSSDQEEIIAATSLAAVAAAGLGLPDKDALLGYLVENQPWEELNLLEVARFLQVALPSAPTAEVAFTLKPGDVKVRLAPGETYTCLRAAEDLPNLSFAGIDGKVGLCVSYRAPASLEGSRAGTGEATLSRAYAAHGKASKAFDASDVVRVTLTYTITGRAPEGSYQIVDFLPSGLKAAPTLFGQGGQDANATHPVEIDGQKVAFNVFLGREYDPVTGQPLERGTSGTVTYYARVVSLGEFNADAAVLVHAKTGGIFAVTSKDAIAIR